MTTYTLEQLSDEGPQYAMAMLLRSIQYGEPFVTYGAIVSELEHQLNIETIFPTHIGHVAGALMDLILEIEPKAPLINVLITRPNGIPGKGAAGYLADRYKNESIRKWKRVSKKTKFEIVERERRKIFKYDKWEAIQRKLFGKSATEKLRNQTGTEYDSPDPGGHGGQAESEEHKKLKDWVSKNPHKIGLRKSFGSDSKEHLLLSGDEIDVLFSEGDSFRAVEVKSLRSNENDIKRGLYQCVKYREVKKAEHLPYQIDVQAILVTERELNQELKERARILNVKHKCVKVNK